MKIVDEINENLDVQYGLNAAFIHILQGLAMTIAMKLPADERKGFNEMLESLAEDEGCVGDLSPDGRKAFGIVVSQVTRLTAAVAKSK